MVTVVNLEILNTDHARMRPIVIGALQDSILAPKGIHRIGLELKLCMVFILFFSLVCSFF